MILTLSILDIINIIGIFQLILFILFLMIKRNKRISNIYLGIFLFAQLTMLVSILCKSHYTYFYNSNPFLIYLGTPSYLLAGPVLFLYVKSMSTPGYKFTIKEILHLLPYFIFLLFFTFFFYIHPAAIKRELLDTVLKTQKPFIIIYTITFYIQILVYNIFSLVTLQKYSQKIKQQFSSLDRINLSWLTLVIWGFIFSWLASVTGFLELIFMIHTPVSFQIIAFISFFVLFNIIFFKGLTQPDLFSATDEKSKYQTSNLTAKAAEEYQQKLTSCMDTQKPYMNPEISLRELAEELKIPQRHLSQLLNEHLKQNFYDYINRYRITEALKLLSSTRSKKTVLEIMYQVGFNSKSAFHQAFKKQTGMTPVQFKRSLSHQNHLANERVV